MFVPYGYLAVYPFQLFGTFIHEAGHALAVVATGGSVESMVVRPDTSGEVMSMGGMSMIISSAGYLGSILVGAALLLGGRRRTWARKTLLVTGSGTLLVTALFSGSGQSLIAFLGLCVGASVIFAGQRRSSRGKSPKYSNLLGGALVLAALAYIGITGGLLTWAIGLLMGGGILAVAFYGSRFIQHLTVLFLGVQLSFDGLNSVQDLWTLTSQGHAHNDAANMANFTGLPATFWAVTWGAMGLVVVAGAFWLFWRQDRRSAK